MKGFIKNETGKAVFKAQRPLNVGANLSFEQAYLTWGEKSGKKEGPTFIKWLRENHFNDDGWIFYKEEGVLYFAEKAESVERKEIASETPPRKKRSTPAKGAGKKLTRKADRVAEKSLTAGSIVDAEPAQAKSMIAQTRDRGVLKKALSLTNHFSHKEEHRRLIQRRLEEVY